MEELLSKIDDIESKAIQRIQKLGTQIDDTESRYIVQDMTTAILRAIKKHKEQLSQ